MCKKKGNLHLGEEFKQSPDPVKPNEVMGFLKMCVSVCVRQEKMNTRGFWDKQESSNLCSMIQTM